MNYHKTPTRKRFAKIMTRVMRRLGIQWPITFDHNSFCLHLAIPGGATFAFGLQDAYSAYCKASPTVRPKVFDFYSKAIPQPIPENPEILLPNIVPRVNSRLAYEHHKLRANFSSFGAPIPHRIVGDNLAVCLAYESSSEFIFITDYYLPLLGYDFDQALEIACSNLAKRSTGSWHSPARGVYISPWKDNHDASRILLIELIRQHEVAGSHLAMVPNANTLIVTGTEEPEGMSEMLRIADECAQDDHAVSGTALFLDGNDLVPLQLLPDHADYKRYKDIIFTIAAKALLGIDHKGNMHELLDFVYSDMLLIT